MLFISVYTYKSPLIKWEMKKLLLSIQEQIFIPVSRSWSCTRYRESQISKDVSKIPVPLDSSENLLRESTIFHRNSSENPPPSPPSWSPPENPEFEPETARSKLVYHVKRKNPNQHDTLLGIPVGGGSIFSICIYAYPFIREKGIFFSI